MALEAFTWQKCQSLRFQWLPITGIVNYPPTWMRRDIQSHSDHALLAMRTCQPPPRRCPQRDHRTRRQPHRRQRCLRDSIHARPQPEFPSLFDITKTISGLQAEQSQNALLSQQLQKSLNAFSRLCHSPLSRGRSSLLARANTVAQSRDSASLRAASCR